MFVCACMCSATVPVYLSIYLSIYLYTHAVLCAYTGRRIHARICLLDAAAGMENGCMYACVFVSKHAIMYPHRDLKPMSRPLDEETALSPFDMRNACVLWLT